ncbi:class I SAM-dependent methyltransferase [Sphingomonas sp. M1-B02]|uniref:class I SAM-dependent methyltransferase n=1 Tax=Sphingomonas sp. M1-B02 TaxID=3114300 RepID=UPI00223FEEF5|nr:class I SAM-dependent methyltransferase [Sphingomonas sp. S6-11]UZK65035.1 class I SAM-dependent methyltransferase [Sphingomonas sp. S6-11]
MSIWTSGYVTDVGYTFGFYPEMSPASLTGALRMSGHDVRLRDDFTYCELGIGQGVTAALLAAAHPEARFYGNDFNASHVLHARDLAAATELTNLTVSPASFQDYVNDPDLPDRFDVIALHGIYSWVDGKLRDAIREFIDRKLAVGGILYISYNAFPGWSAMLPMRQLIFDHGSRGTGSAIDRVKGAIAFVEQVKQLGGGFFRQNPAMGPKFDNLKAMSPAYLAHEYFNQVQQPFYFSAIAEEMSDIGLSFAASANFVDRFARRTMTAEQRAFLDALPSEIERESMFDYFANQVFRRDLFVRGSRPLAPGQANSAPGQRFAAVKPLSEMPEQVVTTTGAASIKRESGEPVLAALLKRPSTTEELVAALSGGAQSTLNVGHSLEYLLAAGCIVPALPAAGEEARSRSTEVFNRHVLARSAESSDLMYLASPVTGQGFSLSRIEMQFLEALAAHGGAVGDWTAPVWDNLRARNERLLKDGKPLASDEENIADLKLRGAEFVAKRVPILRSLGIVQ